MSHLHEPAMLALLTFLETSYGDGELRTLVLMVFPDDALLPSLPGGGASPRDLASCIVLAILHRYGSPPDRFWAYLHKTRGCRKSALVTLQLGFGGPAPDLAVVSVIPALEEAAVPAPAQPIGRELHSIVPGNTPRGSFDLLRCPRPSAADVDEAQDPFALLRPGIVNGMARELLLQWTPHELTLRAIPTLYRSGERMAPRVDLQPPLRSTDFSYYPLGRNSYARTAVRPTVYRFVVERWDRDARSVTLTAGCGLRWRIDLSRTPGG